MLEINYNPSRVIVQKLQRTQVNGSSQWNWTDICTVMLSPEQTRFSDSTIISLLWAFYHEYANNNVNDIRFVTPMGYQIISSQSYLLISRLRFENKLCLVTTFDESGKLEVYGRDNPRFKSFHHLYKVFAKNGGIKRVNWYKTDKEKEKCPETCGKIVFNNGKELTIGFYYSYDTNH